MENITEQSIIDKCIEELFALYPKNNLPTLDGISDVIKFMFRLDLKGKNENIKIRKTFNDDVIFAYGLIIKKVYDHSPKPGVRYIVTIEIHGEKENILIFHNKRFMEETWEKTGEIKQCVLEILDKLLDVCLIARKEEIQKYEQFEKNNENEEALQKKIEKNTIESFIKQFKIDKRK